MSASVRPQSRRNRTRRRQRCGPIGLERSLPHASSASCFAWAMASKYAGARSSASAGVPVPRVLHEERSESFRHSRHLRHKPLNLAARCRPHLVINQRNIIEDLGAAIRIESRQLRKRDVAQPRRLHRGWFLGGETIRSAVHTRTLRRRCQLSRSSA